MSNRIESSLNRKYKWHPSLPDHRDHLFSAQRETIQALPDLVDLRPNMPPVYDQGELGSCTANAIGAAIEYERMRQGLPAIAPSRLFIYYNERAMEGTIHSDSGAQIRDGISSVALKGVCPEDIWPYDVAKFTETPSHQAYGAAVKEMATLYSSVQQNLVQLQSALAEGYPVVFGITVFQSLESPEVAQTGMVPMPNPSEQCLGGHAILACGYDNTKQVFIIRNSWGNGWGDKGYFYLPYSYVLHPQLATDFWVIKMVKS